MDENTTTPTAPQTGTGPASAPESNAPTQGSRAAEPKAEPPKPAPPSPAADTPSAEELEAFRKWQESQRTDAEKHAAAISKAEKARTAAEARAEAAELKVTALGKGVNADALDDVIALAKTKITDKVTADQAIEDILKKYPAFGTPKPTTTGTATPNNNPSPDADDAKARRVMGLPERK